METRDMEILSLVVWVQATVFSWMYNYNDADMLSWWRVAYVVTIQALTFDLFLLLGFYRSRTVFFRWPDVYLANLILQYFIVVLVAFHAHTLLSLTRLNTVNCWLNSFIDLPFGFTFYKFDFLKVFSSIILILRTTRLLANSGLIIDWERDYDEEDFDGYDDDAENDYTLPPYKIV